MKEILENVFAVEVPEGFDTDNDIPEKYMNEALPDGEFKLLFTTKDCTEQQAMKIVAWDMYEDVGILAANYMDDRTGDKKTCSDSLQSLLRSHGLDTNKNYLLLRKTS